MSALTVQERQFVEEYAETGDARLAAIRAGLPDSVGHDMVRIERVRVAIGQKLLDSQLGEGPITPVEVLWFWGRLMRDDTQRMGHRLRASENLGKYLGVLVDRREVIADVNVQAALGVIRGELSQLSTGELREVRKRLIGDESAG